MTPEQFWEACAGLGLDLDSRQKAEFRRFHDALYLANQLRNLTRISSEDAWERHFLDSLLPHAQFPQGAHLLDIGSGPGFPAWPLALARPDLRVTALDSNGKMLGFLRSQPQPNLDVVQARAEEYEVKERFDIVTGRAVAPLAVQLEISARPCRVGGAVIPMRAQPEASPRDVSPLGLRFESATTTKLPDSGAERTFPVFRKVASTQSRYPRPWAIITQAPLA